MSSTSRNCAKYRSVRLRITYHLTKFQMDSYTIRKVLLNVRDAYTNIYELKIISCDRYIYIFFQLETLFFMISNKIPTTLQFEHYLQLQHQGYIKTPLTLPQLYIIKVISTIYKIICLTTICPALEKQPNNTSSMVGRIWHRFVWLNH